MRRCVITDEAGGRRLNRSQGEIVQTVMRDLPDMPLQWPLTATSTMRFRCTELKPKELDEAGQLLYYTRTWILDRSSFLNLSHLAACNLLRLY